MPEQIFRMRLTDSANAPDPNSVNGHLDAFPGEKFSINSVLVRFPTASLECIRNDRKKRNFVWIYYRIEKADYKRAVDAEARARQAAALVAARAKLVQQAKEFKEEALKKAQEAKATSEKAEALEKEADPEAAAKRAAALAAAKKAK